MDRRLTVTEYFEWERAQPTKHEYHLGEHYQREADGSWRYRLLEAGDGVTLSNGARLSIDAIYEGAFELAGD